MKHEFKTGDTVTIGEHGTVQWKLMSKAGRNTFVCRSLSSGKIYPHSTASMKLVKIEPKQDRSELYKLLPRVSEWRNIALYIAVELTGKTFDYISRPTIQHLSNQWYDGGTHDYKGITLLPPSINWKDTLVSREEMEAWEKSQIPAQPEPTEDELNMPICKYYQKLFEEGFTETPQAKVERLKSELKEAEAELERSTPIDFHEITTDASTGVFVGFGIAPKGLKGKCLLFNQSHLRMETQQHSDGQSTYTVLTFFKK